MLAISTNSMDKLATFLNIFSPHSESLAGAVLGAPG
jgi:hypothetical protein